MIVWAVVCLLCAALPAVMYARNIRLFRPPPEPISALPPVSVLIPARNEEASIAACVESVLASRGIDLECIVLDDSSTDCTAAVVHEIAAKDARVRLEVAPPLPAGWSGKQHACFTLSKLARHPLLSFLDADVRLHPDGLARMASFQQGVPLVGLGESSKPDGSGLRLGASSPLSEAERGQIQAPSRRGSRTHPDLRDSEPTS